AHTTRERTVEDPVVAHFAQQRVALAPHNQGPPSLTMDHAVGRELVDRKDQVGGSVPVEPTVARSTTDQPANVGQVVAGEVQRFGVRGRRGQRLPEQGGGRGREVLGLVVIGTRL